MQDAQETKFSHTKSPSRPFKPVKIAYKRESNHPTLDTATRNGATHTTDENVRKTHEFIRSWEYRKPTLRGTRVDSPQSSWKLIWNTKVNPPNQFEQLNPYLIGGHYVCDRNCLNLRATFIPGSLQSHPLPLHVLSKTDLLVKKHDKLYDLNPIVQILNHMKHQQKVKSHRIKLYYKVGPRIY